MWASTYVNCAVATAQGSVYRSEIQYISLPFTVYKGCCQITCLDHNAWTASAWVGETMSSIPIVIWRGTSYSALKWNLKIYIVGSWK